MLIALFVSLMESRQYIARLGISTRFVRGKTVFVDRFRASPHEAWSGRHGEVQAASPKHLRVTAEPSALS